YDCHSYFNHPGITDGSTDRTKDSNCSRDERTNDSAGDLLLAASDIRCAGADCAVHHDLEHGSDPAYTGGHRLALFGGGGVAVWGVLFEVSAVLGEYPALSEFCPAGTKPRSTRTSANAD